MDRKVPSKKVLEDRLSIEYSDWHRNLLEKWWQKDNLKNLDTSTLTEERRSKMIVIKQLLEIMLSIGGSEVCFSYWDSDYEKILERGYYRSGKSKKLKGQPSRCHENVCHIYDKRIEEDDVIICTGFALSKDYMWREHSWLIQKYISSKGERKTRILETTEKRLAYFGFELNRVEANEFADRNIPLF